MLLKKFLSIFSLLILISACSSTSYKIDNKTYQAKSKNSRIRYIIVHYTAINDEKSINALTKNNVSSHYLITTKAKDPIYSLVPDLERAWHAGDSTFGKRTNLNDSSIGIEIVNVGMRPAKSKYNNGNPDYIIPRERYIPFNPVQIDKVAFLIRQLSEKYEIAPENILGHSDIAPGRKQDPGPLFPWEFLYRSHGLGSWYDQRDFNKYYNWSLYDSYSIKAIKAEFKKFGYDMNDTNEWDAPSRKVLYAFQMHYRPKKLTGEMDLETFAIIKALNKKYKK